MSYPNDPYAQQPNSGGQPNPPAYGSQPAQPAYGSQPGADQNAYGSQPGGSPYGSQPGAQSYNAYGAGQGYANAGGTPTGTTNPDDMSLPFYGISFMPAVKRFFKGYAKFSGRASRSEYWYAFLGYVLISLIPMVLYIIGAVMASAGAASAGASSYSGGSGAGGAAASGVGALLLIIGGILLFIIGIGTIVPFFALGWRRVHDAGFAGPMYLLTLIPSVGGIIAIVFGCLPPKPEGMKYDDAPSNNAY